MRRGLLNSHLVCYANCALQCLASCGCVARAAHRVLRLSDGESDCIATRFCQVIDALVGGSGAGQRPADAAPLVRLLARKYPRNLHFNGLNDAGEFFLLLIEALTSQQDGGRGGLLQKELFFGRATTSVRCRSCRKVTRSTEESGVLTLHNEGRVDADMAELVDALFARQDLDDWTCDSCGGSGCTIQYTVTELPRVLLVTFASARCVPGPILSVTFSFGGGSSGGEKKGTEEVTFALRGCMVRAGGHYTATVCVGGQDWVSCDDERTWRVPGPGRGQCLVYERC